MTQTQTLMNSSRVRQSAVAPTRVSLSDIRTGSTGLPNRYFLYAIKGWGKTSLAANSPKPIFIESREETGLEALINNGVLPDTPRFPPCNTWSDINDSVDALIHEEHPYRTLVLDSVNGMERLCHEFVCRRDNNGDWSDRGFASYQKGPEVAMSDWLLLLQKLDKLRTTKRMSIFMLGHAVVATFKNPIGADYDRYQPALNKWTLGATDQWVDAELFGHFEVVVDLKRKNDTKGKGNFKRRVLYTEWNAAFDAKNRLELVPEIDMGNSSKEAWGNFSEALREARSRRLQAAEPQPEAEAEPPAATEEENS